MKNPSKPFSNLHVDSFMDVLWRRRCSTQAEYAQDITVVECSLYLLLANKWDTIKATLQPKKTTPRKKKGRKKDDEWIVFPDIDVMSFVHNEQCVDAVRGGESIQVLPEWWNMQSVLIPCNVGNHWVLCHLFPEDGEFTLYDSLHAKSNSMERVREMDCISYLMPSLLHQSGYYEHKGIEEVPTKPFKAVDYVRPGLPTQNDSIQCGVYMCQFAEFILERTKQP